MLTYLCRHSWQWHSSRRRGGHQRRQWREIRGTRCLLLLSLLGSLSIRHP